MFGIQEISVHILRVITGLFGMYFCKEITRVRVVYASLGCLVYRGNEKKN